MSELDPALAALLGLVEGLTEFLPVSSTGHLIVLGHWLGFTGGMAPALEMAIQFGSILAIVVYERRRIGSILSHASQEMGSFRESVRKSRESSDRNMEEGWGYILYRSFQANPNLWFLLGLGVAFLPAAVIGLLTRAWIETHLSSPVVVAVALIVGGLLILAVEVRPRRPRMTDLTRVDLTTAFYVGLAQCCALIPGVSRPAATILSGLLSGMDRRLATEYSYFLAVPVMTAASAYALFTHREELTGADLQGLAIGMVVSFLVGWSVVATFLNYLKQHTLRPFAYYRILLGMVVLLTFS
jgi:undecaprenyl-diphosphatase